jgi:uncharacterized HAD superfamily protein
MLKNKLNIMVDIDGTVSDDISNEESHKFITASVIDGAVEKVNKLYSEGHIITFFTSRIEEHRKDTEEWLNNNNFKYHQLLMGKPRGGNYVWIDNLNVDGVHFKNNWESTYKEIQVLIKNRCNGT